MSLFKGRNDYIGRIQRSKNQKVIVDYIGQNIPFFAKMFKKRSNFYKECVGYNMDEFSIPNNLYGFSLSGLTSKILWSLKPLDMCYEVWPNNVDHYLQMLVHDQPKYILGMRTYSGVDQDAIRIETITKNKFRNEAIEKDLPTTKTFLLKPFLKQIDRTKYAFCLRKFLV